MPRVIAVVASLLFAAVGSAQTVESNSGEASDSILLKRLFDADQDDRKGSAIDNETAKRDEDRRSQVLAELKARRIRTANDHYHAAMVLQHAVSADDIRLAFSLAWVSASMNSDGVNPKRRDRALWLSAAAWDRIMMREDMPQWYGTQYHADDAKSEFKLYKIDESAVSDEERLRFKVPVLSEAKKRVEILNQKSRQTPKE